jgi:hypothetical protein
VIETSAAWATSLIVICLPFRRRALDISALPNDSVTF